MFELKGEKVILRPLERADAKKLWEDMELASPPTCPLPSPQSMESNDTFFNKLLQVQGQNRYDFALCGLNGQIVGQIALAGLNWQNRAGEIEINIIKTEHRHRGYGTEATRLLIQYAFEELNLNRLSAYVLDVNVNAMECLRKLGFAVEGRARKAVMLSGKRVDNLLYGLLIEDLSTARLPRYVEKIRQNA